MSDAIVVGLAVLVLFGVELAYIGLRGVPSVQITFGLWCQLALQCIALAGPLALSIWVVLAAGDRVAGALARTPVGRSYLFGDALQMALLAVLLPLLLLSTKVQLSLVQQGARVVAGVAAAACVTLLCRWLRTADARTAQFVARSNLAAVVAAGFVLWFLYQGNTLEDLRRDNFGVDDEVGRMGTTVTAGLPVLLTLLSPVTRRLDRVVSGRGWVMLLTVGGTLGALFLIHHVNTVAFCDSYYHYHLALSLFACLASLWAANAVIRSLEPRRLDMRIPGRAGVLVLLGCLLLPLPVLGQAAGPVTYVGAIHTVWLRLGYDATGLLRTHLRPNGVAPQTAVPASVGRQSVPFDRKLRDVVLFLLDAQRADGYSLRGPLSAHIPRTVRCFEGGFEFQRAFSAGTCTEVAYPAFHTSTHGVTRQQVRLRRIASDEWLANAKVTSLNTAMSAAGYRTVLVSDPWYLDRFFDPPELSVMFGRFDDVIRVGPSQAMRVVWDDGRVLRDDGKRLLLVVHIQAHGLEMRPEIDATIGDICDSLAAHGRLQDAVLLLTADHGMQHFEHGRDTYGRTLFNEEARVPLFLRVPGVPGRLVAGNVGFVDHMPTLLDLQGLPVPASAEGHSYLPVLLGATPNPARPVFIETRMAVWGSTAVVRGDFKLIRWHTPAIEAMFHLRNDPAERRTIIDEPTMQREAAELRAWLDGFLQR